MALPGRERCTKVRVRAIADPHAAMAARLQLSSLAVKGSLRFKNRQFGRWMGGALLLLLWSIASDAPAVVKPVTIIERQVVKPNMLVILDSATSMMNAPGGKDADWNEVGLDCDDGDEYCRTVGAPGRCYYGGSGKMGPGIKSDFTSCQTDADCRLGGMMGHAYCKNSYPKTCQGDADARSSGKCNNPTAYCKGYCANALTTACTGDGTCAALPVGPSGEPQRCYGIQSCKLASSFDVCDSGLETECAKDQACGMAAGDFCVKPSDGTSKQSRAKICQVGQQRCYQDSDCAAAIPGDTCGPAISKMVLAKRVLSSVVGAYASRVNFGFMSYFQRNYFAYYKASGPVVSATAVRYLERDYLKASSCWSKTSGPSASCTVNSVTYTLRASLDSRYRIKTGEKTFTTQDVSWCGSAWCPLASGTGYYQGSYYQYVDPQATLPFRSCSQFPLDVTNCSAGETCCQTSCCHVEKAYAGKSIKVGAADYIYWEPPNESRNASNVYGYGQASVNVQPLNSGSQPNNHTDCDSLENGGNWQSDTPAVLESRPVIPPIDTTDDPVKQNTILQGLLTVLDKGQFGGLGAEGSTRTGCTLWNDTANANRVNNAYSYFQSVKAADTFGCRNNYVLLVTHGHANWPNDNNACDSAACTAADPIAAGCTCHSVKASQMLAKAGVKVFVVGFNDASVGTYSSAYLNNVAKAGGTSAAYLVVNETEMRDAITSVIYQAAQGSYSTTPASASSGLQQANGVAMGTMLLDTRVDFPGWRGQLIAYETSSGSPAVAWSASTVAFDYNATTRKYFSDTTPVDRTGEWKQRNVWTSSGTTMVKIQVDQATGAITNKAALKTLGLGATDDEAEKVARWMLGDPALGNPAVLGAFINSTPIDVGPPGSSPLPGGAAFYEANKTRPALTYAGSSDGMLHAFFTRTVTVGATTYNAGKEAFAYIPQSMLAVQNKLYAQGGQLPDPKDHIYGLANSPKVKSLCTASCDGVSGTPVWKTVLAMAYGFGGSEAFVIDITGPFDASGVKSASGTPPVQIAWNTQYLAPSATSIYDDALGLTTSVPAFYYAKSASKDDFRLIFGSYADTGSGSTGKVLVNSSVATGALVDSRTITPPGPACPQAFGLLSDVATARNFGVAEETQILAAYFGDTWGNLYRYVPTVGLHNYTGTTGAVSTVYSLGCQQPVHYVPAIVQLDRDNGVNRPGEIYIVQVTNSALDDETQSYPASKLIIRKDLAAAAGTVSADAAWTPITLTAGTDLCGVTAANGTCSTLLPAAARPNATPLAVLRQDGTGFEVISTWYVPAVNACSPGITYLNIYEVNASGTATLRFATQLASEPVTSTVFVGGKLMFAAEGGVTDLTSRLPSDLKFLPGGSPAGGSSAERIRRLSWIEFP
jgi:hypothetical protein